MLRQGVLARSLAALHPHMRRRTVARVLIAIAALAAAPAFADMFCGPGKHVGSENGDGAGQSWLCVPDRPGASGPAAAPSSSGTRRLPSLPSFTMPSIPNVGNSGMGRAAGVLGGFAGLLGGIQNLQDAMNANGIGQGRDTQREGDLVPGGMSVYTARANDVIGLQYLAMGVALEDQSLVDAAADSYARAEQAANLAGDDELLAMVREHQAALGCRTAIAFVMNTGQNPESRVQQYQKLQGLCKGPLAEVLQALVALEQDRLPGDSPAAQRAERVHKQAKRARMHHDAGEPAAAGEDTPPAGVAEGRRGGPSTVGQQAAQQPPDDGYQDAYWRAQEQQRTRQQIWCDRQGAERESCMAPDNGGAANYCNKFFGNSSRFDDCQHAFHDPNIWYPVTRFSDDPAAARREIDRMLAVSQERIKGGDVRLVKEIP